MSNAVSKLHPAVQHHLANSLGWRSLRPLQEASIGPVSEGEDVLLLGPTAGGKTEAAVIPLLSRMVAEEWLSLSVLYVCPLRALINNLQPRLSGYLGLVGRSAEVWHGDTGEPARKRLLREPPDMLLTTPESLEVMLVSRRVDHERLFRDLRVVVVDEIHAFAGDDRGWHLQFVLERVERLAGRPLQRVGLSATVGNPEELMCWLSAGKKRSGRVVAAEAAEPNGRAVVGIDYVRDLENAGAVIAGLHRGEKRLVFLDSRADVEVLAAALRDRGVETFVSHSSLSHQERRAGEEAFAEAVSCVIVATSTLELGIDVGDLDRVIQVDAPATVGAFLQRLGRTGRREEAVRNTLFLTRTPEALLQAAGLVRLWQERFVEQIEPPARPAHIASQQLLALCLQRGRIGSELWRGWIGQTVEKAGLEDADRLVDWLCERGMLVEEEGMLMIGEAAEQAYGRRNFMDLLSVFTSPPLFEIRHGRQQLGFVHESSFIARDEVQPVLLLAGRSWGVEQIDWRRKVGYVSPAEEPGRSRWIGDGTPLSFELCRSMRAVLAGARVPARLSARARGALEGLRDELSWVRQDATSLVRDGDRVRWWTFAGLRANAELEWRLGQLARRSSGTDNLSVPLDPRVTLEALTGTLAGPPPGAFPVAPEAIDGLKFNECLPEEAAAAVLAQRLRDPRAVRACREEPIHTHIR